MKRVLRRAEPPIIVKTLRILSILSFSPPFLEVHDVQGVHRTTPLLFGAKGPPLITFFLIFPTPKGIVRTSGMATTTVNMIGRIISYGLTKPPQIDDYWTRNGLESSNSWFVREDWPLYAAMAVLSLFGCYLGTKLHDRIKADRFDVYLILLLVLCAVAMISKSLVTFLGSG